MAIQEFIDFLKQNGIEILRTSDIKLGSDSVLIQDKHKKETIYYSLSDNGLFGRAYNCRTDEHFKFSSNAIKKLEPEKRAQAMREQAIKQAEAEKIAKQAQELAIEAGHSYFNSLPIADKSEYFKRKGLNIPIGARQDSESVIIPFSQVKGDFKGYQEIHDNGAKIFMKMSDPKGCFFKIQGADNGYNLVCEGVATGQAIYEATGLSVYVAFNAGNLSKVSKALSDNEPLKKVIICADNDQWTALKPFEGYDKTLTGDNPLWSDWRESGKLYNTGYEKAKAAAIAVCGHVIMPKIQSDDNAKRSDFADLDREEVKTQIMDAIQAIEKHSEQLEDKGDLKFIDDTFTDEEIDRRRILIGDFGLPMRIMGINGDYRVFYSYNEKQLIELKQNDLSYSNLLRLGTANQWHDIIAPDPRTQMPVSSWVRIAQDRINQEAQRKGAFSYDGRVRGAGCWIDGENKVVNTGRNIIVNGEKHELHEARGKNIYVLSYSEFTPATDPLSNKEADDFRQLCKMCPWDKPISGDLLAGSIVIGQVCAIMKWRPIVWISGQKGTGKSTIIEKLLRPALGDISLNFTRGTTESSIREAMGYDARPIIYDEFEPNTSASESVMSLAKSSTGGGGWIGKRGQAKIEPRWSFFFSSTDTFAKDLSEESRQIILRLKQPVGVDRSQQYEGFLRKTREVFQNNFSGRLLTRTTQNIDALLKNTETFTKALNSVLKDSRSSDQVAPLLAGSFLLTSKKVLSHAEACEIVNRNDWGSYTTANEDPDHQRLLDKILSSFVGNPKDHRTIGELIREVLESNNAFSERVLRSYGIVAKNTGVCFANRHDNLKKILAKTQWEFSWASTLSDFEGAESTNVINFSDGIRSRSIQLPCKLILPDSPRFR